MHFSIKKGLDLPLSGQPKQTIDDSKTVTSVALLGEDYHGMKPTMLVNEGDIVKLGQPLFSDKKNPGVQYTSPGAGRVHQIKRGNKRRFQAIIIDLEGNDAITFSSYPAEQLFTLSPQQISQQLLESGLWTAFRTRPYSKVPLANTLPHSIFVTAIDTQPLAADPNVILTQYQQAYQYGLTVLSQLTKGKVHVCQNVAAQPLSALPENIEAHSFSGPHPAGLPSTHIHFIEPVNSDKTVWQIHYQDVIAIGKLFTTGQLWVDRIIAIGGPLVHRPRLVLTRLGACTTELLQDEIPSVQARIVSGSVLSGHEANNWAAFLGRFHHQISVIKEGTEREFMGWIMPGAQKFSKLNVFISRLLGKKSFDLTSSQNGSPRAMVPIGVFETVMPLDILPTQLLRALLVKDTDTAQALGCLELEEEDLALCSFVCSSKVDYGPILRANLTQIEKEG